MYDDGVERGRSIDTFDRCLDDLGGTGLLRHVEGEEFVIPHLGPGVPY